MALLQEMSVTGGSFFINGSLSYAAQDSWVISDTVRNNVVFGKTYNHAQYSQTMESCAMVQVKFRIRYETF